VRCPPGRRLRALPRATRVQARRGARREQHASAAPDPAPPSPLPALLRRCLSQHAAEYPAPLLASVVRTSPCARSSARTGQQRLRLARDGRHRGLAIVDDDAVGQVGGHDEVVLHNERRLLGVHDEALDHLQVTESVERVRVRGKHKRHHTLSGRFCVYAARLCSSRAPRYFRVSTTASAAPHRT